MSESGKTKNKCPDELKKKQEQITELKRQIKDYQWSEKLIREQDNLYCSMVESTDDSIYLVDKNYQYLFMNKKHLSRLGLPGEQFMKRSYSEFHSPQETKRFIEKINNVFRNGKSIQYEYRSERDNKYFLQTFSPVKDTKGNNTAVTIISKDITILKQMEEKLRTLSFSDELTGLYNRRGFFSLAEQQLKLAKRDNKTIVLISADLDYLKIINDNLGHKAGDMVLIETAMVLKKSFRDSDIIARIGGDEFAVLAIEAPEKNVEMLVSRLRENLDEKNENDNRKYELSVSIGAALYEPKKPCSVDILLSKADKEMYKEKKGKQRQG
jgi:diguanylate cyclase (GGDEF)-like protein/PAS domain S-box-containing protein